MPWKIRKRGGEYCVIKEDSGETEGCHATRNEAERHMAALYANEPGAKSRREGPMNDKAEQFERFTAWLRKALGLDKEQSQDRFMVWKEGDRWRWLAIYSNRYRDRDNPPEILSEAAHRDFVKAVDAGEWEPPELWLWHTPGSRSGQADFLAYDDRGFSIASGWFDKNREYVAAALAEDTDLGVSHGMPMSELERDEDDATVITRYRSIEISPLPKKAAANELTGFVTLEGKTMELSKEKRDWLEGKLSPEDLAELDAAIDAKAKEAEGLEFKGDEGTEQVDATPSPEPEPEPDKEPAPDYVTRGEVAEALQALTDQVGAIAEQVGEFGKALKELQESEEERIAKAVELTPAASFLEIVTSSAIGQKAALVDGRTKLAKAAPKETEPNAEKDGAIGMIGRLMDDWRSAVPEATQ